MIRLLSIEFRTLGRALSMGAAAAFCACKEKPAKPAPAAVVSGAVTEAQLSTIKLTADAVTRLGIETFILDSSAVAPTQTIGGEVIVPPGQSLMITAPVSGTVYALPNGSIPPGGSRVSAGQTLMRLVALPPDIARTQQDVTVAEARLKQAQLEADRVVALFKERLVAARDQERAQADLAAAKASYELALGQVRAGSGGGLRNDSSGLSAMAITAPESGVVRQLNVGPGQVVAAGALLAEVVRLDRLWVRVPLYAGDVARVSRSADASIHGLQDATTGPTFRGTPVQAPPTADPLAASVDVYYEVRGAALTPGERVGVTLALRSSSERALVAPLSAVVRDMSGGAWVYEQSDSLTFVRRRVDVLRTVGLQAVLSAGPKVGTRIVKTGAAELFGTEFGTGK